MHKPYFQTEVVTLYHGKVEDAFQSLINPSDFTLVSDPPYNVGYHYDECKDKMDKDDYFRFIAETFKHGPSVIIHYPEAMFRIAKAMDAFPERVVAWVYPSNTPRQHRSVAWFGCKPDFRKDGQPYKNPTDPRIAKRISEGKSARLYDWWEINQVKNVSSEKTEHPCQIPVALMERILKITPGQAFLDPFAGSGTTLVAAQNIGRKAVGIEMSERYCEIIAKRLSDNSRLI
jgi:site-specific DNA-methyltransferase (adenine-specific)